MRQGGKHNIFERLSIFKMHVAIEVGGPLIPDLVGSSFRNLEIHDVNVGLRFFGGNVAEMWVSELGLGHWRDAGIQIIGYSIRTARPRRFGGQPAVAPPLEDADGHEIYVEQLPSYLLEHVGSDAVLQCPPYCAAGSSAGSREVGGGQPSVVLEKIVAGTKNQAPAGWLVDSNAAGVRMQVSQAFLAVGVVLVDKGHGDADVKMLCRAER